MRSDACGAVVTFLGVVRDHAPGGRRVTALEYEIYEDPALSEMAAIAREARERFGECNVAVDQRVGRLAVGEISVAIAVAAPHRAAAFDACEYVIDELKKRVPIWKKELYADGNLRLDRKPRGREVKLDLVARSLRRGRDRILGLRAPACARRHAGGRSRLSSSKHNLDPLCGFLAGHGFRVLSLDFPGHKLGASGGRLRSVDDLTGAMLAVAGFAFERYGAPVYVLGHSMGASTALRACAESPAIAGAVSIATGYGRPSALEALKARGTVDLRGSYVDGLTLEELASETQPLIDGALERLAGRPVLYVAADRDMMVSRESARELFERAPEPKTFALIESDHTYAGENARAAILAWLNELHPREGRAERFAPAAPL